jgi:hypothetical protein
MTVPESWRSKGRFLARAALALVVGYVFVLVLLVATAQQKVDEALTRDNVGYSYSVAVRYYFGKENLKTLVAENRRGLQEATGRLRAAKDRAASAERILSAGAADLRQDLQRLAAAGCAGQPFAAEGPPNPAELLSAAVSTQHCGTSPADVAVRPLAAEVAQGARQLQGQLDDLAAVNREVEDETDHLQLLEGAREEIARQVEAAAKSGGIIAILRVFEESRWPLAKDLVYVPPALMAILLAFVSGAFGALLITLILHVYPDNAFKFTRSESYGARILLGGLIALGVFVLLFSGVAVLGGAGAAGGSHNLMAYSAIGLLAGMFSDQAAAWLSDRSVFKADAGSDPKPELPAADEA